MTKKILALCGFFIAFSALQAHARGGDSGVMLTANAFIYNSKVETNIGGSAEYNTSIYDIKLGYLMGSGLYLGGIYSLQNTDNGTTKEDGSALGASVGYVGRSGFFVQGHYFLSAKYDDYTDGTGYQGDFGYLASVSSSVLLGVELSYRSIEYKKNDSIPALNSYKVTDLMPRLTVGFVF